MICLAQEPLTNVWHNGSSRYSAVATSLENKEGHSCKSEKDNDQLKALIKANPRKTTQKVAEELYID